MSGVRTCVLTALTVTFTAFCSFGCDEPSFEEHRFIVGDLCIAQQRNILQSDFADPSGSAS
jgi:hypothetical protein